jgi:recombination associated protein RdgC
MGALTGSMSTTKFYVRGDLPKNLRRSFTERIALRTFRPLEPDEEAEERAGWCAVGQPLDLDLPADKLFNGPYLSLGLRVDKYRFPARIVQAELAKAAQATLAKSGHERLSKNQKAEIKQRVHAALRRRYFPSMLAVDLVWHLDAGEAYFWSQGRGLIEKLGALFELCFGMTLAENSPFIAAERILPEQRRPRLDSLERTVFHAEGPNGSG